MGCKPCALSVIIQIHLCHFYITHTLLSHSLPMDCIVVNTESFATNYYTFQSWRIRYFIFEVRQHSWVEIHSKKVRGFPAGLWTTLLTIRLGASGRNGNRVVVVDVKVELEKENITLLSAVNITLFSVLRYRACTSICYSIHMYMPSSGKIQSLILRVGYWDNRIGTYSSKMLWKTKL